MKSANEKKLKEKKSAPIKQYYTVTLEVIAPITLIYRVLAETPEQALELSTKIAPCQPPKPNLSMMKKVKAIVYLAGTNMLHLIKNF